MTSFQGDRSLPSLFNLRPSLSTLISFPKAMHALIKDDSFAKRLGEAGRARVKAHFSFEAFTNALNESVEQLFADPKHK